MDTIFAARYRHCMAAMAELHWGLTEFSCLAFHDPLLTSFFTYITYYQLVKWMNDLRFNVFLTVLQPFQDNVCAMEPVYNWKDPCLSNLGPLDQQTGV